MKMGSCGTRMIAPSFDTMKSLSSIGIIATAILFFSCGLYYGLGYSKHSTANLVQTRPTPDFTLWPEDGPVDY